MNILHMKNAGGGYSSRVINWIVMVSDEDMSLKHFLVICFGEVLAK